MPGRPQPRKIRLNRTSRQAQTVYRQCAEEYQFPAQRESQTPARERVLERAAGFGWSRGGKIGSLRSPLQASNNARPARSRALLRKPAPVFRQRRQALAARPNSCEVETDEGRRDYGRELDGRGSV